MKNLTAWAIREVILPCCQVVFGWFGSLMDELGANDLLLFVFVFMSAIAFLVLPLVPHVFYGVESQKRIGDNTESPRQIGYDPDKEIKL